MLCASCSADGHVGADVAGHVLREVFCPVVLMSIGNRLEGSEGPLASSSTLHTVVRIKMGSF